MHTRRQLQEVLAGAALTAGALQETPDHWITYAEVVAGGVAQPDQKTAVHRRKVANYY